MASTMPTLTIEQFEAILPKICDKSTSSDTDKWTKENPLWGHCAVVSLIAQNLFGGKLARASLKDTEFQEMGSHYWNIFLDNTARDFTDSQFKNRKPILTLSERTREYVLYDPETGQPREIMARYKLLAWRLAKELNRGNSLFYNHVYQKCLYNALDSPCQKMRFGTVIVHQPSASTYEFISEGCNKTIEPLKSLCEPTCIRFKIPSRTESMIGACSHAEEGALWNAVKMRIPLSECNLYVAGIYPNGLPYIKKENEFTCLRCAVQIYHSGIKNVFVPVVSGWQSLSGEECVKTAIAYATRLKSM